MNKYIGLYKDYLIVTKGNSIKTVEAYLRDINQYFQITKNNDVNEYLKIINSNKYTASSQNRKISALKSYYNYLIEFNYTSTNPFDNVGFAKKERRLPECLSYPEIVKILDYLKNDLLNKAIVEVLYGCGLRVSELINLKISNIYYDEGLIECMGKGNKKRYVPINIRALNAINEYKMNFRDKLKKKDNDSILFLNKFGHPLRREYVNVMLNKVANKINLNKNIYPHMLRHSFSTHMLENGANLRIIQELLGHENISTTEIYTHVNKKKIIQDYNKYFEEE